MKKACTSCGKTKSLADFYKRNADRYRADCKDCHRKEMRPRSARHYLENKAYYLARNKRRVAEVSRLIRDYKVSRGCADCGLEHPHWRLEFDHLDPERKECDLGEVARLGWRHERIWNEIAKCEVVCANCHRDRTWSRRERDRRRKKGGAMGAAKRRGPRR